MLPVAQRALLIALIGPVIQVLGLIWLLSHLFLDHLHAPLDPRHLFFEGGFLMLGAGLLVSIVCIPVALEVVRASEEDVTLPQFEQTPPEAQARPRFVRRRRAGASE